MWETWVQSLGQEDSLQKGMAAHSSILAWRIQWNSMVGYSPWDGKESDMAKQLTHTFVYQLYFNEAAKTKQNPRKVQTLMSDLHPII